MPSSSSLDKDSPQFQALCRKLASLGFQRWELLRHDELTKGDPFPFLLLLRHILEPATSPCPLALQRLFSTYNWFVVDTNDTRFVHQVFRVLAVEFDVRPSLREHHMLRPGQFAVQKAELVSTVATLFWRRERMLEQQRQRQQDTAGSVVAPDGSPLPRFHDVTLSSASRRRHTTGPASLSPPDAADPAPRMHRPPAALADASSYAALNVSSPYAQPPTTTATTTNTSSSSAQHHRAGASVAVQRHRGSYLRELHAVELERQSAQEALRRRHRSLTYAVREPLATASPPSTAARRPCVVPSSSPLTVMMAHHQSPPLTGRGEGPEEVASFSTPQSRSARHPHPQLALLAEQSPASATRPVPRCWYCNATVADALARCPQCLSAPEQQLHRSPLSHENLSANTSSGSSGHTPRGAGGGQLPLDDHVAVRRM